MNQDHELAKFAVITILNDLIAEKSKLLEDIQQIYHSGMMSNLKWTQKVEEKKFLFKELQSSLEQFMGDVVIQNVKSQLLQKVLLYLKDGLSAFWEEITDFELILEKMEYILSVSYYAVVEFFGLNELTVKQNIPLSENEMILVAKCLIEETQVA